MVVKARGYVDFIFCDKPFTTKSELWSYRAKKTNTSIKYVTYWCQQNIDYFQDIARLNGVKLPQLKVSDTDDYYLPLPPREVQDKIVEILDTFATLCDNLDTEIAQREQQFAEYREQLCSSALNDEGLVKRPIGELGVFYGGLTGKTKKDFGHGAGRFITYTSIFKNREVKFNSLAQVDIREDERQREIAAGDILFTGSSETFDEVGYTSVVTNAPNEPVYLNSFCFGFRFNKNVGINPNFLKHLMMSGDIRKQVKMSANGVTRINISKKLLARNLLIPFPSVETQQEIAEKLDAMQELIDNLRLEREQRQQQFDYYREKLLSFPQKETAEV